MGRRRAEPVSLVERLEAVRAEPFDSDRWTKAGTALLPYDSWPRPDPGPLPVELLAEVLALRPKPQGYNERETLDWRVAWFRERAANALLRRGRKATPAIRPLVESLREPLRGRCDPACCSASSIRSDQIKARLAILQALRRIVPPGELDLPREVLSTLMAPSSRKIALATADLIGRNEADAKRYSAVLIGALEHPYARVVESGARGLRRAGPAVQKQAARPLFRMLKHEDDRVRAEAIAALRAIDGIESKARERIVRLADHDRSASVRWSARRALGRSTRELSSRA